MMWDGKSEAKRTCEIWLIEHMDTGEVVFEYRTYQGNKKKALFNSKKRAEEALQKYIKNPEHYYVFKLYVREAKA